jgi:hypothetical protein
VVGEPRLRAVVRQDPRPVQGRLCDSGSRDLLNARIVPPAVERMAAHVTLHDGTPRFVWTDSRPDQSTCARVLLDSIAERQRWHDQTAVGQAYRSGWRDLNSRPLGGFSPFGSSPDVSGTR